MTDQFKKIMQEKIDKITKQMTGDNQFKQEIAKEVTARIKKRTRDGYGVSAQGEAKKQFDALSPAYVQHRKRNRSDLSGDTSPGKSNLTYSGDMLDSLRYEVGEKITIEVAASEQEKVGWNRKKGRSFLFLSDLDIKYIKQKIKDKVKEILSKK